MLDTPLMQLGKYPYKSAVSQTALMLYQCCGRQCQSCKICNQAISGLFVSETQLVSEDMSGAETEVFQTSLIQTMND
jgi:hypothetical protein